MSINYYGIIILVFTLFPTLLLKLIPSKKGIKVANRHKQLSIIDYISKTGIILFGLINLSGIGYNDSNIILRNIWLVGFIVLIILLYLYHFRYYLHGRSVKYLYDKFIIPSPAYSLEAIIFLFSSIILLNYITLSFSIVYLFVHTYLGICYNKLARFM